MTCWLLLVKQTGVHLIRDPTQMLFLQRSLGDYTNWHRTSPTTSTAPSTAPSQTLPPCHPVVQHFKNRIHNSPRSPAVMKNLVPFLRCLIAHSILSLRNPFCLTSAKVDKEIPVCLSLAAGRGAHLVSSIRTKELSLHPYHMTNRNSKSVCQKVLEWK